MVYITLRAITIESCTLESRGTVIVQRRWSLHPLQHDIETNAITNKLPVYGCRYNVLYRAAHFLLCCYTSRQADNTWPDTQHKAALLDTIYEHAVVEWHVDGCEVVLSNCAISCWEEFTGWLDVQPGEQCHSRCRQYEHKSFQWVQFGEFQINHPLPSDISPEQIHGKPPRLWLTCHIQTWPVTSPTLYNCPNQTSNNLLQPNTSLTNYSIN